MIDEYPSVDCGELRGIDTPTCTVVFKGINPIAKDYINDHPDWVESGSFR